MPKAKWKLPQSQKMLFFPGTLTVGEGFQHQVGPDSIGDPEVGIIDYGPTLDGLGLGVNEDSMSHVGGPHSWTSSLMINRQYFSSKIYIIHLHQGQIGNWCPGFCVHS
ncbi:hypothetical protein EDC04DRAFT_2604180 [Pisolithus marmoratus]|nr:hypothetical protein EDC04DRAFT_2604180 [Pisolithus marmoratus]